jgi:hypothetical protein
MQPYNIEIFGRDYVLKQHYNTESIEYKMDYLSIEENSVYLPFQSDIKKGDYIRVCNNIDDYFGVITSIVIDEKNEGYCTVGFKPFIAIFDANIPFDISAQGSGTLEDAIADYITSNWISGSDSSQNIAGLSVETISETSNWTFYISSSSGLSIELVNFESIIQEALTKYRVGLYIEPSIGTQKINLKIGIKTAAAYTIEADLPNVIERSIIFNKTKSDTNKLIVYNKDNLTQTAIYYLHPNGTYNTTDNNRIVPVIYETAEVSPSGGKTFADLAQEEANKLFGNNFEKNLIELRVLNEDVLVKASSLEIGRLVNIICNGITYQSLLTGYEIEHTTKLIFGTVRIDLTKILKGVLK